MHEASRSPHRWVAPVSPIETMSESREYDVVAPGAGPAAGVCAGRVARVLVEALSVRSAAQAARDELNPLARYERS